MNRRKFLERLGVSTAAGGVAGTFGMHAYNSLFYQTKGEVVAGINFRLEYLIKLSEDFSIEAFDKQLALIKSGELSNHELLLFARNADRFYPEKVDKDFYRHKNQIPYALQEEIRKRRLSEPEQRNFIECESFDIKFAVIANEYGVSTDVLFNTINSKNLFKFERDDIKYRLTDEYANLLSLETATRMAVKKINLSESEQIAIVNLNSFDLVQDLMANRKSQKFKSVESLIFKKWEQGVYPADIKGQHLRNLMDSNQEWRRFL